MESFSFPQQRLLSPRQTDWTLLDLTFCVRLDSLLGCCSVLLSVVGNFLAKFETGGQTSSYVQTFAALLGQQRWEWLRPFARGFSFNRRTKYSGNGWGGGEGRGKALFSLRKYTLSERRNVFEGSVSTILSPTVASLWRASKLHHASVKFSLLKLNTLSVLYVLLIPTDKSKRKFAACKSI